MQYVYICMYIYLVLNAYVAVILHARFHFYCCIVNMQSITNGYASTLKRTQLTHFNFIAVYVQSVKCVCVCMCV